MEASPRRKSPRSKLRDREQRITKSWIDANKDVFENILPQYLDDQSLARLSRVSKDFKSMTKKELESRKSKYVKEHMDLAKKHLFRIRMNFFTQYENSSPETQMQMRKEIANKFIYLIDAEPDWEYFLRFNGFPKPEIQKGLVYLYQKYIDPYIDVDKVLSIVLKDKPLKFTKDYYIELPKPKKGRKWGFSTSIFFP